MRFALALATACALLSVPALAQSPTALHTTGATLAGKRISTPEFVNKVIQSDMFNIQAARLAEQKGDRTGGTFARKVASDRAKATDNLKMMVNAGTVNANIPAALDPEHQQKLTQVQNLWGQSFDNAYNRDLLQNNQNEISLFQQYARSGDNAALKQWATKMLPEMKSHLLYAQILSGEGPRGPAREQWQYDTPSIDLAV